MSTFYTNTFCPSIFSSVLVDHTQVQEQAVLVWPCDGYLPLKGQVSRLAVNLAPAIKYTNHLPILASSPVPLRRHVSSFNHKALVSPWISAQAFTVSLLRVMAIIASRLPLAWSSLHASFHCIARSSMIISSIVSILYLRVPFKLIHLLRFFLTEMVRWEQRIIFLSWIQDQIPMGQKLTHVQKSFWLSQLAPPVTAQSQGDWNHRAVTFL